MKQCSLFDISTNYVSFINELSYILNHYKRTKAVYNQIEIANYILSRMEYYDL